MNAAMKEFEFPGKLTRMVQLTIKNATCSTRVQLNLSAQFDTTNGFRQGIVLACLLFNVAL
jgi:hypothetical protein